MLVALYLMIALAAWFYPQQPEIAIMLSGTSIAEALKAGNFSYAIPSLSTASMLATATTSLFYTAIATATATTTVSDVAKSTSTSVMGAAQAVPTGNQVLSEELQRLIEDYHVLADTIKKELGSLTASQTSTTGSPEKTASNRQHRSIQYAKHS